MAKVLAVLFPDPVDGHPQEYPRPDIPRSLSIRVGKVLRRRVELIFLRVSCWEMFRENWDCGIIWKATDTRWW